MTINENLKKFRREKGNTQEELAEHLGISMQAVSKWERGEGYPDITLIPAISLYYNVTIDKLFGMDEKFIDAKIKEYEAKALEVQNQAERIEPNENQLKQIALWREALKEVPNNHRVLIRLLTHLVYPVWNVGKYFEEIVQIGERLLAESTDNPIRFQVINLLCDTYSNQKDFESAKKYANMVPSYLSSKEILYGRCLSGEERIKYRQENLRGFVINAINSHCIQDMLNCNIPRKELIKIYEFAYKLNHLLFEDGDFGYYESFMGYTCFNLANWHSSFNNNDEALFYLDEMAEHFDKADQYCHMEGEFKQTSFMINRLTSPEYKLPRNTVWGNVAKAIKQIEDTESFDSVRSNTKYLSAIRKLKKIIGVTADETTQPTEAETGLMPAEQSTQSANLDIAFSNLQIEINAKINDLQIRYDPLPEKYKAEFRELSFEARKTGETNWLGLNVMWMQTTSMSMTSLMSHEPSESKDIADGEYEIGIRSIADNSDYAENHMIPPQKVTITVCGKPVSDYSAVAVRSFESHYMFSGAHIQDNSLYSVELRTKEDGSFFKGTVRSEMNGNTLKMPLYGDKNGAPLSFARLRLADVSSNSGGNSYTITYSPYNSVSVPIIVQ